MKKDILFMALGNVLWGTVPLFWKMLSQLNSVYLLASRVFWSFICCIVALLVTQRLAALKPVIRNTRAFWLTMLNGAVIAANWGLYIWAVNTGHIVDSCLGYYICPLMVVLIDTVLFREKLSNAEILSVALAAAGVVIMAVRFGRIPYISFLLAGSFALYGTVKKIAGLDSEISLTLETAAILPAALLFIVISEYSHTGAIGSLHGAQYLLLPMTGVITTIPLFFFGYGIKKLPYSVVGILQYVNPTVQLFFGVFLFGESFTFTHFITFAFIWIALLVFLSSKISHAQPS